MSESTAVPAKAEILSETESVTGNPNAGAKRRKRREIKEAELITVIDSDSESVASEEPERGTKPTLSGVLSQGHPSAEGNETNGNLPNNCSVSIRPPKLKLPQRQESSGSQEKVQQVNKSGNDSTGVVSTSTSSASQQTLNLPPKMTVKSYLLSLINYCNRLKEENKQLGSERTASLVFMKEWGQKSKRQKEKIRRLRDKLATLEKKLGEAMSVGADADASAFITLKESHEVLKLQLEKSQETINTTTPILMKLKQQVKQILEEYEVENERGGSSGAGGQPGKPDGFQDFSSPGAVLKKIENFEQDFNRVFEESMKQQEATRDTLRNANEKLEGFRVQLIELLGKSSSTKVGQSQNQEGLEAASSPTTGNRKRKLQGQKARN